MRVAVTGASGHLGRVLVPHLRAAVHDVVEIGRLWPRHLSCDVLVHLATPDWRSPQREFDDFTETFLRPLTDWAWSGTGRVVTLGSWWQYATGDAGDLAYTQTKNVQQRMLGGSGPVLIPFSIYGDAARAGRGFVPQLVAHLNGGPRLMAASQQPRSWVHVTDVCRAVDVALTAPCGVYDVCGDRDLAPADIADAFGVRLPYYRDDPNATPVHAHPRLPAWSPTVDVLNHVRSEIAREAA